MNNNYINVELLEDLPEIGIDYKKGNKIYGFDKEVAKGLIEAGKMKRLDDGFDPDIITDREDQQEEE